MPPDRPVVVADVELDVLLAPEPEADPRLRQLRREEGRNPRAEDGAVLELEPLRDRERGCRCCEQAGDDQRGSELLHRASILRRAGQAEPALPSLVGVASDA